MTSVELKTFTYAKGFQSLSIDNAILGLIPKRLIFAMVDNGEFLGSLTRNPFKLQHFDDLFYTIRQGKTYLATVYTWTPTAIKKSVMSYRSHFEGSGIRHSNSGLQISHDSFVNGYLMLLFDLTPVLSASEGHTSHPDSGNIRIEARFSKALPLATTCLLYLEYDGCVRIDSSRTVTTDF